MPHKKMGRPTILNNKLIDELTNIIKAGNYAITACNAIGIGESTFYSWKEKGERDIENNTDSIYKEFVEALKKADAESEMKVVDRFYNEALAPGSFVAPATFAERRWPERWGRKDRSTIQFEEKKPFNITRVVIVRPTDDPRNQIVDAEYKELPEGKEDGT